MPNNPYVATTIRCAGPNCPSIKGPTNGWFVVNTDSPLASPEWVYSVFLWIDEHLDEKALPVCGEACLARVVSSLLPRNHKEPLTKEESSVPSP